VGDQIKRAAAGLEIEQRCGQMDADKKHPALLASTGIRPAESGWAGRRRGKPAEAFRSAAIGQRDQVA
jgi:hypothetical protein